MKRFTRVIWAGVMILLLFMAQFQDSLAQSTAGTDLDIEALYRQILPQVDPLFENLPETIKRISIGGFTLDPDYPIKIDRLALMLETYLVNGDLVNLVECNYCRMIAVNTSAGSNEADTRFLAGNQKKMIALAKTIGLDAYIHSLVSINEEEGYLETTLQIVSAQDNTVISSDTFRSAVIKKHHSHSLAILPFVSIGSEATTIENGEYVDRKIDSVTVLQYRYLTPTLYSDFMIGGDIEYIQSNDSNQSGELRFNGSIWYVTTVYVFPFSIRETQFLSASLSYGSGILSGTLDGSRAYASVSGYKFGLNVNVFNLFFVGLDLYALKANTLEQNLVYQRNTITVNQTINGEGAGLSLRYAF